MIFISYLKYNQIILHLNIDMLQVNKNHKKIKNLKSGKIKK